MPTRLSEERKDCALWAIYEISVVIIMLIMKKITIRQKIALILFGLFLCTILLEAGLRIGGVIILSSQEYRNRISLKKDGYRILCLGESMTQGGYPEQLDLILNDMDPTKEFSVINKGIGGTNTGIILTRLESYLEKYMPDIVITMMGINDDHFPGTVSPVEDIFEERKDEKIYNVNDLRIYKLFKLLKLHINEKLKGIRHETTEELEDIFKKEIKVNPLDASGYFNLGVHYLYKKRFKEAEDMFKKAIDVDPMHESGYLELGGSYQHRMKFEEAEKAFKKAIEINPMNGRGYIGLGVCYREQFRLKEAEEMFKKAIAINPMYEGGYITLGWCYKKQDRYKEAEEMFKKALAINPKDEHTRHFLLICSQQNRKNDFNIEDRRSSYYLPSTIINYRKLRDILMKRGIALICVEYPMRDMEELKSIIGEHKNVYLVDNEKSFKEAVEREGYETYFIDRFGKDSGHMTAKGKGLLARNITDLLFKEYFNK